MTKHIPNFITSLNLASGFIAIVYAVNGDPTTASWFILLAMVFDFLDGFSARMLKAFSPIGKELDSLADVVSFGVAPAVVIYTILSSITGAKVFSLDQTATLGSIITLAVPAIMAIFTALRLAKFNIDDSQKESFKGLASPASALAVITLVLAQSYSDYKFVDLFMGSLSAVSLLSICLSLLMVCGIPMISLKFHNLRFKENAGRFILIFMVIADLAILGMGGALLIIPFYLIISLIFPPKTIQ